MDEISSTTNYIKVKSFKLLTAEKIAKLKTKVLEKLEESSSHGLPRILKSKLAFLKLFWAVCFLASICSCSYMILSGLFEYLDYDIVSKIVKIHEAKSLFPAVTICNTNALATANARDLVNKTIHTYFSNRANDTDLSFIFALDERSRMIAYEKSFGDENRRLLGFSLTEMVILCLFNEKYCHLKDFKWSFDLRYGNCFTFNYEQNSSMSINMPGPDSGLSLFLYLPAGENPKSYAYDEGFKMFIHNSTEKPYFAGGIGLGLSKSHDIIIEREFVNNYPYPYSSCLSLEAFDSTYFRFIKNLNGVYRQQDCLELCYQQQIAQKCNCYSLYYINMFDVAPCLTNDEIDCANEQYEAFKWSDNKKECFELCPKECSSINYGVFASSTNYPSDSFYDSMKETFNFNFERNASIRERLLVVNIFYSELAYTVISESPKYTIIDLFSKLGGFLGLFAGLSMLSVVEIVELVIELVLILFKK